MEKEYRLWLDSFQIARIASLIEERMTQDRIANVITEEDDAIMRKIWSLRNEMKRIVSQ
jgi:hypothetical protein